MTTANVPVVTTVRQGEFIESPVHSHAEGQLTYAERGYLLLEADGKTVRLAADRAAWIPGYMSHSVLIHDSFRYFSLYFRPGLSPLKQFSVFQVAPLLRELILDAASWWGNEGRHESEIRKAQVLSDELARAPQLAAGIQVPTDPRIARIFREIDQDPADGRSLKDWSGIVNASEKTLHRIFVFHTGLTFSRWRMNIRMTKALEMCARKVRLLDIALTVGYSTESAFCQAFKRFYGQSPRHFAQLLLSASPPR